MAAELPPRQMPPELAQLLPSPCQGLFASFCLYCPSFPHLGFTFCHQAKHPPICAPPPRLTASAILKGTSTQSLR